MLKKQPFIILFFLLTSTLYPHRNDTEAAIYNRATNAIIGGVGALINKKQNEKSGKVFFKGIYQGALGGYVTFESKRLVRQFSNSGNYAYLWPSKILNAAGNSITYNAASNRNLWERWHIDFGFNYLEYDFKREKKLRYRILPLALAANIRGFAIAEFDFRRTLYSGHFIFKNNNISPIYGVDPIGETLLNTIQFECNILNDIDGILAHEIIHVYQYNDLFAINTFLNKPLAKWNQNSTFLKAYHKIFYTDFNAFALGAITGTQLLFGVEYQNLIEEREAFYYSNTTY